MAASFTTTATTLEGQALEIGRELQKAEEAYNLANPNTPVNNTQLSTDFEANQITITITLPVAVTGTGNQLAIASAPYLP